MRLLSRIAPWAAGPPVLLVSGLVFVLAVWVVNVAGVPGLMRSETLGRVGILDMDYAYPPEHAQRKLAAYGPEGRAAYHQFLTRVDFAYPAVVGWFLCVATLALTRSAFPRRPALKVLGIVPILLTLTDWAENIAILGMLRRYPVPMPRLARISSALTLVKAAAGITSLAILLFLVLVIAVRWGRRRLSSGGGA